MASFAGCRTLGPMSSRTATQIESKLLRAYAAKTPGSRALFERARGILPNGVTHVGRYLEPYPVYVARAAGSRKWDVDGNEYVDYLGGHGALLLGHCHPAVTDAVSRQVAMGAHYGASHELEVQWAELIHQMVPSAEKVRFTISGTEATHLSLRLARAFTGKDKIIRFAGHFHGWHDHVCFPEGGAPGIVPGIVTDTFILKPNDTERVEELLSTRNDIAAVILEPTGATFGHIPTSGEVLRKLRTVTAANGALLIFDEVICGFRCSPGGAQEHFGVTPDLATLAKIVAGGYPGAAIGGRADVLSLLDYHNDGTRITPPKVVHQGTYNAGPVSAAAGIETLRIVRHTDAIARANRTAAAIRDGLNEAILEKGISWCVYGFFSDFHIFANPDRAGVAAEDVYAGRIAWAKLKSGMPTELIHKIRAGFLANGVDIAGWPGGLVSAVHTDEDVERTVSAFRSVLKDLGEDGDLD